MIKRSTWILLVIFLAVLGGAWYFQKYQTDKQANVTPTATYKLLFGNLDETQITGIQVSSAEGKKTILSVDEAGTWMVSGHPATETDLSAVEDILGKITSMTILSELDPAPDGGVMGLTTPAYSILISLQDGSQKTVYLGSLTPTQSGYFGYDENGKAVVVGQYAVNSLIDLLDNPPVSTPAIVITETTVGESTPTVQP
jgi:hypothetical protein